MDGVEWDGWSGMGWMEWNGMDGVEWDGWSGMGWMEWNGMAGWEMGWTESRMGWQGGKWDGQSPEWDGRMGKTLETLETSEMDLVKIWYMTQQTTKGRGPNDGELLFGLS